MNIPVFDLGPEVESLWDELQEAIRGVLRSGYFIMGPNVKAFEDEVARYLGVKHAVGLNSGTDALVIALRAFGIGPGDEVITTPFTFFATSEAISQVGATPVFVDIAPTTFTIDADLVETAITSRTKAILPVHLYGQSADMGAVIEIARRHELRVIEDVAQAFGGEYLGRKLGTIGDVGAYSFFPTKNLGAYGDAGLLVTNDDGAAEAARMLRVHGSRKKYFNEEVGYNSRLDEIQAAILRVKLSHIDDFNKGRRRVANHYSEMFKDIRGILTPREASYSHHVFHQYTVRILDGRRNEVQVRLAEAGIGTMVYYPTPVHQLPIYAGLSSTLPIAEKAAGEVLSLPIWPQLSDEKVHAVGQAVRSALC